MRDERHPCEVPHRLIERRQFEDENDVLEQLHRQMLSLGRPIQAIRIEAGRFTIMELEPAQNKRS